MKGELFKMAFGVFYKKDNSTSLLIDLEKEHDVLFV
jgi:hypothetical protein